MQCRTSRLWRAGTVDLAAPSPELAGCASRPASKAERSRADKLVWLGTIGERSLHDGSDSTVVFADAGRVRRSAWCSLEPAATATSVPPTGSVSPTTTA